MAHKRTRRPAQTSRKAASQRAQSRRSILPTVIVFSVLLAVVVLLAPWEPTRQAAVSMTGADLSATGTYATDLRVTEAMSSNRAALPDENGSYPDWIELTNTGAATLNIENYGVSDRADKIRFTFPSHTLAPGERVIVYASDTTQNIEGKPFHAKFKLSSKGDTIYLFGPDGVAYETIEVPPLQTDNSYALGEDGWVITGLYSPGYENSQAGYEAFLADRAVEPGVLMINEVLASNRTTQADEDGEYTDWIELYNSSDKDFDISGFGLSDNPSEPLQWTFAEGTVVPARGFLLVFASKKDRPGGDGYPPHTNFGLAAEGETVVLSDTLGRLIDRVTYDNLQPDTSWGRQETGDRSWVLFLSPTPGMPNNLKSQTMLDDRMIAQNESGVYITEVVTSNTKYADRYGEYADYIELYNSTASPVNLLGYGLSDSLKRPRKWQMPDVDIQPYSYLVVWCNGTNRVRETDTGIKTYYSNFSLSLAGETVVFANPSGKILDRIRVPQLVADVSYGRTVGQSGLFYYATATPGDKNAGGVAGFAPSPAFETLGGMYPNVMEVTLSVPEGTQVRYTVDGSDPTEASMLYQDPIHLPGTTVLRARAFAPNALPSQTITQTYFISVYHSLPVISLVTDPWNVWNEDTGMLADGPTLDRENQKPPWFEKNATYGKKVHYDGFVEMYDTDGTQLISQGMDFHVMGQYSLDMPQKSWAINAKTRYEPGMFNVALFEDREFTSYKNFVLRNGGQDGQYTRVLDGLQARIAAQAPGTTVLTQAWRPVIVYLNGEYWGQYNLRERINRYFVAQHENWADPDAMDLLEASKTVRWGSNKEYLELIDFVKNNDLRDPQNMAYVESQVDIDNLFDYFIFEMYYGNTDPGNIRFYKLHGEGQKWRWILYDVDWGLFSSQNGGVEYVLREGGMGIYHIDNTLIRGVLQNPEMQDKFLRRMGELFQTIFTPENIIPVFEEMVAEIQPELQMHYSTFAEQMHPKISFDVPKNPEGAYNYWIQRVERFYNVVNKRPNIFWGMVQDYFKLSDEQMLDYMGPRPALPAE